MQEISIRCTVLQKILNLPPQSDVVSIVGAVQELVLFRDHHRLCREHFLQFKQEVARLKQVIQEKMFQLASIRIANYSHTIQSQTTQPSITQPPPPTIATIPTPNSIPIPNSTPILTQPMTQPIQQQTTSSCYSPIQQPEHPPTQPIPTPSPTLIPPPTPITMPTFTNVKKQEIEQSNISDGVDQNRGSQQKERTIKGQIRGKKVKKQVKKVFLGISDFQEL